MKILIDTSALVPALVDVLPNHTVARRAVLDAIDHGNRLYATTHAMAETFSTLSTLPIRPTISAADARRMLQADLFNQVTLVALTPQDYRAAIDAVVAGGFRGGIIYDALHLQAAKKARVDRVMTFNLSHFERLWPDHAGIIFAPS